MIVPTFRRLIPFQRARAGSVWYSIWRTSAAALIAMAGMVGGANADEIRVVTTIKPVHALASQVLDGISTPRLLIKGAASPHVYALKPSDAEAVHHADLFVRVAPWVEPFTEKIIRAVPPSVHVLTLIKARGLELLKVRDSGAFESHDHGAAHHADDGHDAHHGDEGHGDHSDHDEHDHGDAHKQKKEKSSSTADPHIWLDPENAADMVRTLVADLQRIAPQHKDKLAQNGAAALARLETLKNDLKTKIDPVTAARFIVFHDAFQYFEKRFGLQAAGAITLHPEAPPSAKRLREIRGKIRSASARCVFSEPQFNAKRIATVVEGTNAKTGVLDPIGVDTPPGPDAYDAMMHKLADGFVACLTDQK